MCKQFEYSVWIRLRRKGGLYMLTKKQIAALKFMIFEAKDGTPLTKQILSLLIDRSQELTKDVCLSLVDGREGYGADEINVAAHGVGAMTSGNGTTYLDELCVLMGAQLGFSVHYGDFDPTRSEDQFDTSGMFPGAPLKTVSDPRLVREGMPMRYTFWLSKKNYSRQAELITANREELEKIDIKKSGLDPNLEE
jgi:hypothetical protein